MSQAIGFWIPVSYGEKGSFGQRLSEYADSYFCHGRKVIVIAGKPQNPTKEVVFGHSLLKIISYASLIFPIIIFMAKITLRTLYPVYKPIFTAPRRLCLGVRDKPSENILEDLLVNFAEIETGGQTEVLAVQTSHGIEGQYTTFMGSSFYLLLKMIQETHDKKDRNRLSETPHEMYFPLKSLLKNPHNHIISSKEFIQFLLTPDRYGTLPIQTINKQSLLEVLELAEENSITIDWTRRDPVTHETLFSMWAGSSSVKFMKTLLEIDPSLIRQTGGSAVSFFTKAMLGGHFKEARFLLQKMKDANVELKPVDLWMKKVLLGEKDFTREKFTTLPLEFQSEIYRAANRYMQMEFLGRIRELGLYKTAEKPRRAALFSDNMDAIEVYQTTHDFLQDLRRAGLLMTTEQFSSQKDSSKYVGKGKGAALGRILGKKYIEKVAGRLHLKHIKVPKKIAVIEPNGHYKDVFSLSTGGRHSMGLASDDLHVYAKKITPVPRKVTKEEMSEILDILVATGYNDLGQGSNVVVGTNESGEEGIFFIDTEYTNFTYFDFLQAVYLYNFMNEFDHEWLKTEISRRSTLSGEKEEEPLIRQTYEEHGFADERSLTFPI